MIHTLFTKTVIYPTFDLILNKMGERIVGLKVIWVCVGSEQYALTGDFAVSLQKTLELIDETRYKELRF